MGSIQSYLSTQTTVIILVVAGAVSYHVLSGLVQHILAPQPRPPSSQDSQDAKTPTGPGAGAASSGKKNKKKKQTKAQSDNSSVATSATNVKPNVVAFPTVIPGGFDDAEGVAEVAEASSKAAKSKKKKGKKAVVGGGTRSIPVDQQSESSATAPESTVSSSTKSKKKKSPTPRTLATTQSDMGGPWTRVEPRRHAPSEDMSGSRPDGLTETPDDMRRVASETGIATSVTGNSSPTTERTADDAQSSTRDDLQDNRRTLAEKLVPKPRKTKVDDMLETSDVPTLARVMRVQPRPDERPAAGFSWADYEDVDDLRATADDADGEDDGWVVKSGRSRPKTTRASSSPQARTQHAPETMTKKQRQNAAKREADKSAKMEAEAERQAALAKHKRELERTRMLEQFSSKSKKTVSGGASASIDEKGHMVWD